MVIHRDQRGAGTSTPRDFDRHNMKLEQFLQDAHEVTCHGAGPILVLDHFRDFMLGARLVAH